MLPQLKDKYDYKKALKTLFNPPSKSPELVTVPPMQFLSIEGKGSPNNNPEFEAAVSALYGSAYTIKFARKKAGIEPEYSVQPLEGLWWVEGADPANYLNVPLDQWHWRLLIGQPNFVTHADLEFSSHLMKLLVVNVQQQNKQRDQDRPKNKPNKTE